MYYNTQRNDVTNDIEDTAHISDIIFGEYFLIYGSLYMKKNVIAYIQFINNRWFFYFQYAGIFYSFYTENDTNRYMDLSVFQNNFFTRAFLIIFFSWYHFILFFYCIRPTKRTISGPF